MYVVARTSSGMRQESVRSLRLTMATHLCFNLSSPQAILLAFLGALVTAIAEIWLYIAYSRRSARRAKEGEALRLAETRQAGLSKEPLVPDGEDKRRAEASTGDAIGEGKKKVEGGDIGVSVAGVTDLATEEKATTQSSREEPRTGTIRLRRKPLGSTLE